jgi:DNA-binding XRE family transcriptional regulator
VSRDTIPFNEIAAEWHKDPEYQAAYDALESEFVIAELFIRTRIAANMSQEEVARAMGTTQSTIARLESGRSQPSTRTLTRFAHATNTRLRISFESQPYKSF